MALNLFRPGGTAAAQEGRAPAAGTVGLMARIPRPLRLLLLMLRLLQQEWRRLRLVLRLPQQHHCARLALPLLPLLLRPPPPVHLFRLVLS
jgi:hypothetical protein